MELVEVIKELHQLTLSFCNKGKSFLSDMSLCELQADKRNLFW